MAGLQKLAPQHELLKLSHPSKRLPEGFQVLDPIPLRGIWASPCRCQSALHTR